MDELYERRLLVFLETEPQSNKYNQIFLTPEQFKIISSNTGTKISNNLEYEEYSTLLSTTEYLLPDLQSIDYTLDK